MAEVLEIYYSNMPLMASIEWGVSFNGEVILVPEGRDVAESIAEESEGRLVSRLTYTRVTEWANHG